MTMFEGEGLILTLRCVADHPYERFVAVSGHPTPGGPALVFHMGSRPQHREHAPRASVSHRGIPCRCPVTSRASGRTARLTGNRDRAGAKALQEGRAAQVRARLRASAGEKAPGRDVVGSICHGGSSPVFLTTTEKSSGKPAGFREWVTGRRNAMMARGSPTCCPPD
jgi:hypothetical protein